LLLDYAGISILIGGSFLPPIFYGFYCDTQLRNLYLALITVLSLFSCFVGLYSGIWPSEHLKFVRVIAYRCARASLPCLPRLPAACLTCRSSVHGPSVAMPSYLSAICRPRGTGSVGDSVDELLTCVC